MGTAGALANFQHILGETDFWVVYGDNCVRPDYAEMARIHSQKGGLATIALHYREDVSMSGIVVMNAADRILRFIEKPAPADQISHWVNAGVYLLSPEIYRQLPAGESDFGRDIFPQLLAAGQSLFGYRLEAEVTPIDTPELYRKALERRHS